MLTSTGACSSSARIEASPRISSAARRRKMSAPKGSVSGSSR